MKKKMKILRKIVFGVAFIPCYATLFILCFYLLSNFISIDYISLGGVYDVDKIHGKSYSLEDVEIPSGIKFRNNSMNPHKLKQWIDVYFPNLQK